jgi:DNA-binding NarL/FixJ family response regulator
MRIIIVAADNAFRRLLVDTVAAQYRGGEILEFETAREGLKAIEEGGVGLAIIDHDETRRSTQSMLGAQLSIALRASAKNAKALLLADVEPAEHRADWFLPKPPDIRDIQRIIVESLLGTTVSTR